MVTVKKYETPAVYAAFGAAISFYFFPFIKKAPMLINGGFIFFIIVIGFFTVLSLTPFIYGNETGRLKKLFPKILTLSIAFSTGCAIGLAGRSSIPDAPVLGLETDRVNSISGILKEDPRLFNDGRGMGTIELKNAGSSNGITTSAYGSIRVFFPPEAVDRIVEFGRGCEIYAEGKIISYRNGNQFFRSSAVYITKSASSQEQLRGSIRAKLLEKFGSGSGGPVWGGLASALLLGVRDNLDNDLTAAFRDAGCSYILALSGMHLAIFSGVLAFFLRRIMSFRLAVITGGLFIIFYVYLAGGQPSLVRAAIMYIMGAVCILGFLKKEPFNILCLAFLLQMIFQTESALSIAFMLSYLALAGILISGEAVHGIFRGRIPEIAGSSLSASIGAFIITIPVVALYFENIYPAGIIASLVVVPLISLFMIIALAALILLFPLPVLFPFFDFILTINYRIIEFIVSITGKAPGIKAEPAVSTVVCIALTALILLLGKADEKYRGNIASFDN